MTTIFKLTTFFLITYGLFSVFKVDIKKARSELSEFVGSKEYSIKSKILIAKKKKKENAILKLIFDTKNLLELAGRKERFSFIVIASVFGFTGSIVFSLSVNNIYIFLPLSIICLLAPFYYVKISYQRIEKMINEELETALSIITNSYIRNENIILAVEENIAYINVPVKNVFRDFLTQCNYISPDIKENLNNLKYKINNEVFTEYCNALILCQNDINQKHTLFPIVKKLSNIRIVSARLEGLMYTPVKEFFMMILIYLINLPLFYFLNKDWYKIVMETEIGHIMIAASLSVITFAIIKVLQLSKPIVYRR